MNESQRVHPKRLKAGDVIYDEYNYVYQVVRNVDISGVLYVTILRVVDDKYMEIVYDMHDYTGKGGSPLPKFSRKKITVNKKIVEGYTCL
jgi:hypothetical protein